MAIRLTETRLRQIIREEASRLTHRRRVNEMMDDDSYAQMDRENVRMRAHDKIGEELSRAYGYDVAMAISDTCSDGGKASMKRKFPTLKRVLDSMPGLNTNDEYFWSDVNDRISSLAIPTPPEVPQEWVSWAIDGTEEPRRPMPF